MKDAPQKVDGSEADGPLDVESICTLTFPKSQTDPRCVNMLSELVSGMSGEISQVLVIPRKI